MVEIENQIEWCSNDIDFSDLVAWDEIVASAATTGNANPPVRVERVREWAHGPTDKSCSRKEKLIHVPVNKLPDKCGRGFGYGCGTDEWISRGIVRRLRSENKEVDRKIIAREN